MDITNENFLEVLPNITEAIEQCDFIAIDTELSGLLRERSINRFELPEERFAKSVESSKGYFIMQFGLSCFKQQEPLHYSNKTYNFYIFPQANGTHGDINRTFSLQAHAIQFLVEHGFDFNKLFKHGISYLTFQEKKAIAARRNGVVEEEERKNDLIAKGFLEVLEVIILQKKPLVGHNLALDLIQIINQFIEPLSSDYTAFKEVCHSLFPVIYDTKFIAHDILEAETLTNNQSRLNDLYCQLRDSDDLPRIKIDNIGEPSHKDQLPHEAGFDAFMSGYCFLVLCESYIREKKKHKSKKKEESAQLEQPPPPKTPLDPMVVSDFANKIHLAYSYDYKCYNLSGDEKEPDRSHVFYLEFPKTWLLDDIFGVFRKFNAGVTVGRLGRTSALCALRNPKLAEKVTKKLKDHNDSNYKIYTYEFYVENFKLKKKLQLDEEGDMPMLD